MFTLPEMFRITYIYALSKLLALHPDEGGSVLPGDCVSDPEEEWGREGAVLRTLLGSPWTSKTKGTLWHRLTHPRKHYFLSHQPPTSSTYEPLTSKS